MLYFIGNVLLIKTFPDTVCVLLDRLREYPVMYTETRPSALGMSDPICEPLILTFLDDKKS